MPVFNTKDLLTQLEQDVQRMNDQMSRVTSLDAATLNRQPASGKWSALQVIEHLNSYNRYYLPEMEKALGNSSKYKSNPGFKAGIFGNYFTKMMQPGEGDKIANKMNAPKEHTPVAALNKDKVLKEFTQQQVRLSVLLKKAATTDMGKLKVPISISKFIKLKLGDTFRFLIAHQQRHFIQLHKALVT